MVSHAACDVVVSARWLACRHYIRRHGLWQGNRIERTSCRCHRGRRRVEPKARARWACVCVCCLLCITAAPAAAAAAAATALDLDDGPNAPHRHRPARPGPRTGRDCMAVCVSGRGGGGRCVSVSLCPGRQSKAQKTQRESMHILADDSPTLRAPWLHTHTYIVHDMCVCSRRAHPCLPLRLRLHTAEPSNPWPSIDQSPPRQMSTNLIRRPRAAALGYFGNARAQ